LLLQNRNTDINFADNYGTTAINQGSFKGNLEVVKLLMKEKHLDVNYAIYPRYGGSTPLISAVRQGHQKVVEHLLKHEDIDVNVPELQGGTALYLAVLNDSEEMIQLLLATNKIDMSVRFKNGYTYAEQAAWQGNAKSVELLLTAAKCAKLAPNGESKYLLHIAADRGHAGVVATVLDHVEDVNTQDIRGNTALHYAASQGNVDIVQLLLNAPRVNIGLLDKTHKTPLALAVDKKRTAVTTMLMEKDGFETLVEHPNEQAVLRYAVQKGDKQVVRRLLREIPVYTRLDFHAVDEQGRTLMWLALEQHDEEMVKLLVSQDRITLHLLIRKGELHLVESLLKAGYDVDQPENGRNPLHTAISSGQLDIAKALVSSGAPVDGKKIDANGADSPISLALSQRKCDFIDFLLENSASITDIPGNAWWRAYSKELSHVLCMAETQELKRSVTFDDEEAALAKLKKVTDTYGVKRRLL
jgi:ankyrin repeat protein